MITQKQAFVLYLGLGWVALFIGEVFGAWEFITLGIVFEVLGFAKSIENHH